MVESVTEPRMDRAEGPAPRFYLPSPVGPQRAPALYLRSHGNAAALAQPLRELVGELAPQVPVVDAGTMEEHNLRAFGPQLWLARAAAALGVIALVLGAAGLYGVASQGVAARSREIGVRMALGAAPRAILAMVFAQSMRIALFGLVLGGLTAVGLSRVIQAGYHGIARLDAVALGGAAATFVVAMVVASLVPALRAARLDPIETLKDA